MLGRFFRGLDRLRNKRPRLKIPVRQASPAVGDSGFAGCALERYLARLQTADETWVDL
jgi:hypothetical protein